MRRLLIISFILLLSVTTYAKKYNYVIEPKGLKLNTTVDNITTDSNLTGSTASDTELMTSKAVLNTIEDGTLTVINKSIDGNNNTLSNIPSSALSNNIDATKLADGTVDNIEFQYINSLSSNAQDQINGKQSTITGAATTITDSDLIGNRVVTSNSSGKITNSTVTDTELSYLDNVSSDIQSQLDSKQATITGAATTVDDTDLTSDRTLISDASGKIAVSDITNTELSYLDNATSNIQGQIDNLNASQIASSIETDTTNFDGILDSGDTNVQSALDSIDDHIHGTFTASTNGFAPSSGTADGTKVLYDNGTWAQPPGASGGEANTASNVGSGVGLYKQKTGVDLEFKSLANTDGLISLSSDTDTGIINISNKTGADTSVVTGTAGTSGNVVVWKANGSVGDGGVTPGSGGSGGVDIWEVRSLTYSYY